jgi:Fe-S cluster assembly protein SufD
VSTPRPSLQTFVDAFGASACLERSAPAVAEARAGALARAAAVGLPDRRDERWRYTDLRRIGSTTTGGAAPVPGPALHAVLLRLEFVDGVLQPWRGELPAGLSLRRVTPLDADAVPQLALAEPGIDAFIELNAAFADGGMRLEVAAGAKFDAPIEIVHRSQTQAAAGAHARLRVSVGRGARLGVVERVATAGGLSNGVTQVELAAGAELDWLRLSEAASGARNLGWFDANLAADARITLHSHLGSGELDRFAARVRLAGRAARADLYALSVVDGRARADQMLAIEHLAPATVSRQTYRGVAGGRAAAAATCRASIAAEAAGADAQQSLGSLPLSTSAECAARPELEIHCDDVACRHGATVGQLDEQALFYLRSRGLDPAEARALLVFAFADAALAALPRDAFRAALEARLAAASR